MNAKRSPFGALLAALVLVAVGVAAYGNAVAHPFVHDDVVFIVKNPHIGDWLNFRDIVFRPASPEQGPGIINRYYRPFLEWVYRAEYAAFGMDPHSFHLVNVLLHIANACLVYGLMSFLALPFASALAVALVFLAHPVQSEAVACVAGISNLFFTFWMLVSLNAYAGLLSARAGRPKVRYAVALVSFYLALWAKEQALMLLLLVIPLEVFFAHVRAERRTVKCLRWAGLALVAMCYLGFRQYLWGDFSGPVLGSPMETGLRLLAIPRTLVTDIGLLLFPVGLHYYRCLNILDPWWPGFIFLIAVLTGPVMAVARWPSAERRLMALGAAWFVLALVPTLNFMPLIVEYSWIMTAEHFLYVAVIGFAMIGVVGMGYLLRGAGMRLKACVLAVLVAVGVSFTVYQNTFWRSELALFERSVYFEPQVGRIRALLAKACFFSGKVDEAIWHYQKAGEIFTTYADRVRDTDKRNFYNGFLKGIHFDLAQCFLAKGRIALSTEEYERALALDPRDSVILSNMAMNAMMEGKVERAVQVLQQALAIDPGNLQTLNNLGVCLMGRGDAAGAEAAWRKALAVDPGFLPARDNLRKMGLK